MSGEQVYIVECVRTPIGKGREDGKLHSIHPIDLLAITLDTVVNRAGVKKGDVEDVICGCVTPLREQGANIPRLALLKAGFPQHVPGVQLNRMCGSGQQAIHFASQAIAAGDMDLVIGCGVEMMGTVKMGSDSNVLTKGTPDGYTGDFPVKLLHQGLSADILAAKYGVTREEVDAFAVRSHERAHNATQRGYFKQQIVPVTVKKQQKNADASALVQIEVVDKDEGIRYPVDKAALAKLRTIFKKDGVVTAGNASQISDGAAAVLLASEKKIKQLGLRKRARIVARAVVGSDPVTMLDGVIPATRKVLEKANMTINDIDVFEVNEAFACVVLAWMKTLGIPEDKVNPNGGAIAHGHPLGATGAVLMTKLVNELERTNKRFGLLTMCIGHGQATATIIENCSWAQNRSKM
eukprot:GEZU01002053.1.p1 GENE.GEZU01002053.1~~GEZU01002053.1.p1  ORF type:complete len:408 (+),score=128.26 GEZU01002053.1:63-1286(+)